MSPQTKMLWQILLPPAILMSAARDRYLGYHEIVAYYIPVYAALSR